MSKRTGPRFSLQAKILNDQEFRCAYCLFPLGSVVQTRRSREITRLEWDHFVPYSYIQKNPDENWVAACRVCNSLKGSYVFDTLEDARLYILERWQKKDYYVLWQPSVSCEEDLDRWTEEYQCFDAKPVISQPDPRSNERRQFNPKPPTYIDLGRGVWSWSSPGQDTTMSKYEQKRLRSRCRDERRRSAKQRQATGL